MGARRDYVRYYAASMASIGDWRISKGQTSSKLRVNFQDKEYHAELDIFDRVEDRGGVKLHSGLDMIATIDQHNMNEVSTLSRGLVDTVLDVISFVTVAYCERLIMSSLITFGDDGNAVGELYSSPPATDYFTVAIPRTIEKDVLKAVFEAKDRSAAKVRDRISRSLAWFRKSIVDKNTVIQFISLWIALETISPLLRDELQQRIRNPGKWDGARHIFMNEIPTVTFDDIHSIRQTLFHSLGQITPEFSDKLASFVEPMRRASIFGIGSILKLDRPSVEKAAGLTTLNMFSISSYGLRGKFHNLPNDIGELMKHYPAMRVDKFTYQYVPDDQGRRSVDISFNMKASLPAGTVFTAESGLLAGAKNARIKPVRFSVNE